MNTATSLTELVTTVNAYKGSWKNAQLAREVNAFLWATYDPRDDFIYPNIKGWDSLLQKTIDTNSYGTLAKDQVLSILFGIHHRNRIVDGLWEGMFLRDVTQKLLGRLLIVDADFTG